MTHDLIMPLLEKVKLQKVAKKFENDIMQDHFTISEGLAIYW